MTQGDEEKGRDEEQRPDEVSKKPEPNLSYRLRSRAHKFFPKLIQHPSVAESLAYYISRDPAKNAESTPPDDELVDLRCVWVVEFYTPAHVERLIAAFEKLGWDNDDSQIRKNPVTWIQRLREQPYGGGWLNLGHIKESKSNSILDRPRVAPMPPHVSHATGELYSLTSSLNCIVMGFTFDDEYSRRYDEALRTYRQTYFEPLERGHRIIRPESQKADHIRRLRAEARRHAASWFSEHLPGLFASGVLDGEFPTCEFVSLRAAEPFPERRSGSGRPPAYMSALALDLDLDAWFYADMPALKFAWPIIRDEQSRYHAILAIKEDEFDEEECKSWGGSEREAQTNYVDHMIKGLLCRWAMLPMLTGYGRHLNAMRDSAIYRSETSQNPVSVLNTLGRHVSYNVDIAAVTAELIPYAREAGLFGHGVETFLPCNTRRYDDPNFTLTTGFASRITERAEWLQTTDQSLRDHLTQYGSLLAASENVGTQKSLQTLTIVIAALTLYLAGAAAVESGLWSQIQSVLKDLYSYLVLS